MNVKVIRDIGEFMALKGPWQALLEASEDNAVHYTHGWLLSWWRCFGNSNRLNIVTVEDENGELAAIAPMMLTSFSYHGVKADKICFLVNGHSPSAGLILRPDRAGECVNAVLTYLETFSDWDMVHLQKLKQDMNASKQIISYLAGSKHPYGLRNNIESPYIRIDSDWESFLKKRSTRFIKGMRNKINRIQRTGDVEIARIGISRGDDPAIHDMFMVSERSWKRDVGTDLVSDTFARDFYINLCDTLGPLGVVTLWLMRKNGYPIAFEFHLTYNGVVYPIRGDYDKAYNSLSPGSVLETEILKTLFTESRVREYNTCGNTYEYLMRWTESTRKHVDVEIYQKNLRSMLIYLIRHKVKPSLPNFCKLAKPGDKAKGHGLCLVKTP